MTKATQPSARKRRPLRLAVGSFLKDLVGLAADVFFCGNCEGQEENRGVGQGDELHKKTCFAPA